MFPNIEFNEAAFKHNISEIGGKMARMTEEEAYALDEEITNAEITLKPEAEFLPDNAN